MTNKVYIPKEDVKRFSLRSDFVGFLLVAHCWGTILLVGTLFIIWPTIISFVLAIAIIGGRQLGMAILMHECAHGILFKSPKLNKIIGQYVLAYPIGADLPSYRSYHLKHHKFTQTKDDPDIALSAPFPITKKSLRRKIIRDLAGLTGIKLRYGQILMTVKQYNKTTENKNQAFDVKNIIGPYLTNLALFMVCYMSGLWWAYFVVWLIPLLTTFQLVVRIRNIAEHALTTASDPLKQARTTYANLLERVFVAPYWVNYHLEHHLYMYVPCWRLKGLHASMSRQGHTPNMEIQPSYAQVLRLAAPAS